MTQTMDIMNKATELNAENLAQVTGGIAAAHGYGPDGQEYYLGGREEYYLGGLEENNGYVVIREIACKFKPYQW